jgi:hypothetical protein
MPKPIEIREYATEKEMQRDANKWLSRGYTITSQTYDKPSAGCGRWLIAGPFALLWKPKPRWIVTYQRR